MRKYYASFIYNDKEYVIRFKSKKFQYDPRAICRCFIYDNYYVRSVDDMIKWAAFGSSGSNIKQDIMGWLIDHKTFVEARANGVERWNAQCEVLI